MQPSTPTFELPPKRHTARNIIIGVVVLIIVAAATFFVVRYMQQINLENSVKSELIKQNKIIQASAVNNVYKQTLPVSVASTDKVKINAKVSMTGTQYCIAAVSTSNEKIVYHMDQGTPGDAPVKGDCGSGSAQAMSPVPGNVSVASTGAKDLTLQWDQSLYASGYTVECATNASFTTGFVSKTTSKITFNVDGLTSDMQYYCRVASTNQLGQSAWSQTVTGRTTLYSQPPTNMKASIISSTELSYSWDAVAGADYYMLQYTTDINFVKDVTTTKVTATSGSVKGLAPYTGYFFRVEAVTADFDGSTAAYSDAAFARTTH